MQYENFTKILCVGAGVVAWVIIFVAGKHDEPVHGAILLLFVQETCWAGWQIFVFGSNK